MMDGEQFVDCISVQYVKQLSQSDAACSKQIKLPKSLAKKFVGELRHKQSTVLTVLDQDYGCWEFLCTCYGCQYALSRVGTFCNTFRLKAGQFLVFYLDSRNRLRVGASCNISPELQQHFSHRQASGSNTSSSSSSGSGASPTHATAAAPASVQLLLSGSSSDGSERKALTGKRSRRVVERGPDVMAVKDQSTSLDQLPQNAWSRAPSPDDNMLNAAAALPCPYSFGAFEQRMAKRLCSASPVNQLTRCHLQQQQQQREQGHQGPVTSMKPGGSSDAFQQQLQQQQQQRQQRCVTTAVLPPPALFAPPLRGSNSSSDSGDSSGTCTGAGFARLGMSCIGSAARMKALGLLVRQVSGNAVPGHDEQEPADELLLAPGVAPWQPRAIAAHTVTHSYMAAATAAATAAVTAAQGPRAGPWMPIKPTPVRAAAPTSTPAAAAAAAGAWPARPALPLLAKALTKMDVACAHDRVGIVLPMEAVLHSQLLSNETGSLAFVVGDEAGSNCRFSCRIAASANGRFAYLTGLGALLSRAAAVAGDAVCISVAQGGAGLVAGVRRAQKSA